MLNYAEHLRQIQAAGKKISMVTCYDSTFAGICQESGIDTVLIGDSVANTMLGYAKTAQIGMREMLHHTGAVRRGGPKLAILADMPYGSDETPETALRNGLKLKEAGADAVKLEGPKFASIRALTDGGVPVMAHLGLLPQTAVNYKQKGRDAAEAEKIFTDAQAAVEAGACSVLLEHIPSELATRITDALDVPTIGIGAGSHCSGQVLVLQDMLGMSVHRPPFARDFAGLRALILKGLNDYDSAVKDGSFPA